MIVVLNSFTSWCQSEVTDSLSSTGGLYKTDSLVVVPISTIKQANAKMVELKYEKEINSKLTTLLVNDSIIIQGLKQNVNAYKDIANNERKKAKTYKRQRNILGVCSILLSALTVAFAVK